jgi:hypothetical protein
MRDAFALKGRILIDEMKKLLNPDEILFLSVPTAKDKLVWNAHRICGPLRLSLLLDGWEIVDSFRFHKALLATEINANEIPTQPVFVLRNNRWVGEAP